MVCGMGGQPVGNEADLPSAAASPSGEDGSLYTTGDSEEELGLPTDALIRGEPVTESVEDMKSCIATLDASQNVMVRKLGALEKLMMSVQEDITGVRGEVGVVNEILEKLSDYVSLLSNTVAEVDGMPAPRSPAPSAWGGWGNDAHLKDAEGGITDGWSRQRTRDPRRLQLSPCGPRRR